MKSTFLAERGVTVFELLFAQILERYFQVVVDLLADVRGDTNTVRWRELLETGGNVDPVPVPVPGHVVAVNNDVADVDADTQADSGAVAAPGFARDHVALEIDRAPYGRGCAREFGQEAVASRFDEAAAVLVDLACATSSRSCRSRANVTVSSRSSMRLKPATSATMIAASLRSVARVTTADSPYPTQTLAKFAIGGLMHSFRRRVPASSRRVPYRVSGILSRSRSPASCECPLYGQAANGRSAVLCRAQSVVLHPNTQYFVQGS